MLKKFNTLLPLTIILATGCAPADVGAQFEKIARTTLASEQRVTAKTTLMKPKLKAVTSEGFKILYMDPAFSQGKGVPINVRDMASTQCQTLEKVAMYLGADQDTYRLYMITAQYKCVVGKLVD